jgi:hypothetical protein
MGYQPSNGVTYDPKLTYLDRVVSKAVFLPATSFGLICGDLFGDAVAVATAAAVFVVFPSFRRRSTTLCR